jgi:PleD family two-component response regulator
MSRWAAIIADEDADSAALIKRWLSPQRYEILTVADASGIAAAAARYKLVLVLTSATLPGLSIGKLCRSLRGAPQYTYLIYLLQDYAPSQVVAAYDAGADEVIAKPLIAAELRARLQRAARVLALEEVRAQITSEADLLAEISAATRVHSQRYLQTQLEVELARAHRFSHPLAVTLGEARAIPNDRHLMHMLGDFLAVHLRSRIDWVACYEERLLALVTPETSLAGAVSVARRLHAKLSDDAVLASAGLPTALDMNFGISAVDPEQLSLHATIDTQEMLGAARHKLHEAGRLTGGGVAAAPVPYS